MTSSKRSRVANPTAVRRLKVVGEVDREIVITIGKPRPDPKGDWRCSFLVEGVPNERRRFARGIDPLQALQLAIESAKHTVKATGLVCTWLDGEPGDIGIPRTVPSYPGSGFSQRIERYIDRELEKFARDAKRSSGGQASATNLTGIKQRE